MNSATPPRVLIVGGGFGGLNAARALRRARADITLLDRRNHHLFQPLLYQVATAALSPGDIAAPLRKILERQRNCSVYLGEAAAIDLDARRLTLSDQRTQLEYDYLVLAAGVRTAYFHHDEWAALAPGLKTIDDATDIRRRYLLAFEQAELERDPDARRRVLTFAVVGAGPTGVEMAGAMIELARQTMRRSFRHLDTRDARVILIDGNDRVLTAFPKSLSQRAQRDLERLGVELRLGERVVEVSDRGLTLQRADGQRTEIETPNIIWAAGVEAVPLTLHAAEPVELDRHGRVKVNPDLSIPHHPEAFVVGDLAEAFSAPRRQRAPSTGERGSPVPGVAQGAIQMGKHAGHLIAREIAEGTTPGSSPRASFHYVDKGELATIGRARAVAQVGRLEFAGFPAWFLWATVHIMYLIGYRSRLITMLQWVWLYFCYDRGVRLITGRDALPHPNQPPRDPPR
ncbi:MAG: NAD(P)/FAD-dependent oxidoreductase [Phycisphaerales bacterium]|nr:NAD(P)/FAD-dependent oxidoreductase [Phycisphaerales bacterium]